MAAVMRVGDRVLYETLEETWVEVELVAIHPTSAQHWIFRRSDYAYSPSAAPEGFPGCGVAHIRSLRAAILPPSDPDALLEWLLS